MRPHIVVVNDNDDFLALVQDLLENEDYEVTVCKRSDHAFQRIKEHMPDLVILDLIFGGEPEGWAVLDMIKLDPQTKDLPVILCSAAVLRLREAKPALDRKGVHCLEKPFELDEFLDAIQRALSRQAPPQ